MIMNEQQTMPYYLSDEVDSFFRWSMTITNKTKIRYPKKKSLLPGADPGFVAKGGGRE
jgi:hypothetical protein